jgi:hypothetical protein
MTPADRDWQRVRAYLTEHRHDLAVQAAAGYPAAARVAGTPLLAAPGWLPSVPVRLDDIAIDLDPAPFLPERADGTRYSDAIRRLAAPAVFENRTTYRLTGADLAGPSPRLAFGRGRYFDGIDTGAGGRGCPAQARLAAPRDPARVDLWPRQSTLSVNVLASRGQNGVRV